ncbi:MAG: MarR family transcriptional regulator [Solirubrobacterales bacterium]
MAAPTTKSPKAVATKAVATNPVARDIAEALWTLLASGKPRFPRIAAEFDLTPPQLHLLRLLRERDSLPMGQIAEMLFCDASNVTVLVDRLEERGLIERTPDPSDRRVKRIVATKAGSKLQQQVLQRLYQSPPGILTLSDSEQSDLRDLLQKAVDLQEDFSDDWD